MSRRAMVLAAVGVVLVLGALVGGRLWRIARFPAATQSHPEGDRQTVLPRFEGAAPAADVPEPPPASFDGLEAPPCWSCRNRRVPRAEFSIDLDRLAPLGDGEGNLAEWLKDFALNGARQQESNGAGSRVALFGEQTAVREADDPLLVEAEAWVDQAVCSFYPEVYEIRGEATYVPNLIMTLTLARSWVARGLATADAKAARDDMRRSIRLGRLLRQDDFTVIQELVGLATIRLGA